MSSAKKAEKVFVVLAHKKTFFCLFYRAKPASELKQSESGRPTAKQKRAHEKVSHMTQQV